MDANILRKIRKCLELASDKRGDPNTAAAALRQAQALMRQHGVTERQAAASAVEDARADLGAWSRPSAWELGLAHMLCRAFGCAVMVVLGVPATRTLSQVRFFGVNGAAETAAYAFTVVRRAALAARAEHMRTVPARLSRGEKMAEGDTFVRGYLSNLDKQIAELKTPDAVCAAKELALGPQSKVLNPKVKLGGGNSYYAGAAAGKDLHLHRAAGVDDRAPALPAPPSLVTARGALNGIEHLVKES